MHVLLRGAQSGTAAAAMVLILVLNGTILGMAMNLRLRSDAEAALRAEAERSRRSQQDVLRDAVDCYLGLREAGPRAEDELISSGKVRPPRTAYRKVVPAEDAVCAVPSLVLLDREDRF
jgi:hypothetical protein